MRKKLLIGFAVFAIAAIAAFNINMDSAKIQFSALSLNNVEALANESGPVYCPGGSKVCAEGDKEWLFKK